MPPARLLVRVALAGAVVACAACGLSRSGTSNAAAEDGGAGLDASMADGALADGALADGAVDRGDAADALDEAPADARPCVAFDAGGAVAFSAFATKGNAVWNENGDGRITLTNSNNHERGAAWSPTPLPMVGGLDLTWAFRVGPMNTSGDGIAFAVLDSAGAPDVGDDGDGIGLRNLRGPDGGALGGWAIVVDTYKSPGDPTDLGPATLKIVALPAFRVVAATAVSAAMNDGNVYAVDVTWRAPTTVDATLHGPGGAVVATSNDPALVMPGRALFGFTGATGGTSDSHNEVASLGFTFACD